MWRPLSKIAALIPEDKWKHFRKHRFKARFSKPENYNNRYQDYSKGIRVGKLYSDTYGGTTVNIVPIATPARWYPSSVEEIEVFINDEQYRTKILPVVLSE